MAMMADGEQPQASPFSKLSRWRWWIVVAINITFLIVGQCVAVILGNFYYDKGGNSKWLSAVIQSIGFPVLYVPLYIFRASSGPSVASSGQWWKLFLIYIVLGVLLSADNLLDAAALLYLSASTFSLVCASQLAFNAVCSHFVNKQKLTFPIITSVVLLTFSCALIGLEESTDPPEGVTRFKYFLGFVCALGASLVYAVYLSLMQVSFEKVVKRKTFSVVLETQIYVSLVATLVNLIGLLASGEHKTLHGEMNTFKTGKVSYIMTLVWISLSWQMCLVGAVGLVFSVSSLFSVVVSTLSLAVSPLAAVIVFHDPMGGTKIIAMLIAIYGFISYGYQNYVDESTQRKSKGLPQSQGTLPAESNEPPC